MRMSPIEKVNAGFLIAMGLVAIIGVATITSIQRFTETSREVSRTHSVLAEMERVLTKLTEAESAQRGYVITGLESYLAPYDSATSTVLDQIQRLSATTFEDPEQQSRLAELKPLAQRRLDLTREVIAARRAGSAEATGRVASGEGRATMDRIRAIAAEFQEVELRRLEERNDHARTRAGLALAIIGGGSAFAFLVVLGSGMVIRRDITERRRAELALRNNETLLSQFMENLPIGVMVVDAQWQPRFANNAAVEILGPGVFVDIGQPPLSLYRMANADPYRHEDTPIARALDGETSTIDDAGVIVDGALIPLQVSAAPIYDASGGIAYAIATFDDIVERRRGEEALKKAVAEAEAASRTKSDFLARMSHELRTPLNSVIGFANILLKNKAGNLREQDVAYLDRILENGKHLLLLINDILDLSKIEAGKVEVERESTDLAALITSVVGQLDAHGKRGVELRTDLPADVDPVHTDPARLRQVLINLVGNAVKFTERGTVTVTLEQSRGTTRPSAIRVADTGIGIPANRLDAIFDAFEQAESTTSRTHGGTGLGLPISRALCELLGYGLTVSSSPGRGTVFTIDLTAAGDMSAHTRSAAAPPPATASRPRGDRLVVIVDDDADSRMLLEQFVEEFGCKAVSTHSPVTALALARELKPSLITLDLMTPDFHGWDLLSGLKEDPELAGIPVVIVSVVANETRATLLGAVDLLQKPVERDRLFQLMERHLGSRRARILIIDDEADALQLLRLMLDDRASELRTAHDGQDALAVLRSFEPDIVITDLLMPVMDGMTFLEIFRATPRFRHVPVVVVSGHDISAEERVRLERHASAIVRKGSALETDLRGVLGAVLNDDSAGGSVRAGTTP
ncbi:MAG: response regulator [Gemmatimonadota bacterium]